MNGNGETQTRERERAPELAMPFRLLYPVADVAVLLGVSERTVWSLLDRGDLASVTIGRRRLVAAGAINTYMARLGLADRLPELAKRP